MHWDKSRRKKRRACVRRICCSWLGFELPLLALARIAGAKGGLQLALERPAEDCCSDLLSRLKMKREDYWCSV
jgi:hypothetical protein